MLTPFGINLKHDIIKLSRATSHIVDVNVDKLLLLILVSNGLGFKLLGVEENRQVKKSSKLLNGCSEFVLTYEDKEGDWMLIGDVPWG